MMTSSFPSSFEESNINKKDLIKRWIMSKIDHSCIERGQPHSFTGRTSFYHTELPDFHNLSPAFTARVYAALVDEDVKEDLERAGLINWCRNVRTVIPLSVPRDGNCLLHSVATAIWGIRDTELMLRRVLGMVLAIDLGRHFYLRWLNYQQNQLSQLRVRTFGPDPEHLSREWTEITQCLDPDQSCSVAVPHRFLEAIHVYALANILRRPIIVVTDPTMRTFSGLSLQDNDMGGIYLPLEWRCEDTWRTPVVLAYTHSHFSPLVVVKSGPAQSRGAGSLIPLVSRRLQQLPVRFLLAGEGPVVGELLKKYLRIRETLLQVDGGQLQNILCTEMESLTLPEELCLVKDYFQLCQQQFRLESTGSLSSQFPQYQLGMSPVIGGRELRNPPSYHTGFRNQAQGSRQYVGPEQGQRMQNNVYFTGDPSLSLGSSWGHGEVEIPAPSFTPHQSVFPQNASLRSAQEKRCVRPGCRYCGDPELGMMCSECFKNYTIKESQQIAAGRIAGRVAPTAPLATMQEEEQQLQLSMMTERCREGCGLRCSNKTYPYCHECAARLQRRNQQTGNLGGASTPGTPGRVALAAGGAASSGQSQGGAKGQIVDPINDLNKTGSPLNDLNKTSTPPGAALQSSQMSHAATVTPQKSQGRSQAGVTASVGGRGGEVTSPTAALETGSLLAPLTPPDESSRDELLFGLGQSSQLPGSQPSSSTSRLPANGVPSQFTEQAKPGTSQQPKEEQPLFSLPSSSQHQPLPPPGFASGQDPLVPSAVLGENPLSASVPGMPGTVPAGECAKQRCQNKAYFRGLCGECFISKGVADVNVADPAVEKLKMASICSTSSSAPASVGHTAGALSSSLGGGSKEMEVMSPLQEINRASSLTQLSGPSQRLLTSHVPAKGEWTNESSRRPEDTKALGRQSFLNGQPLGLPEKQETELSGNDLVASGAECCSPPRCIGDGCSNSVLTEGALCEECKAILRGFHQTQRFAASVQGSGQQHPERTHPPARAQSPIPSGSAPRPLVGAFPPPEQHGRQCITPGCSMFGDPKQADMCSVHYQQYLSRAFPPSQHTENPGAGPLSLQTASLGNLHERSQRHPVQVADPQTLGALVANQGGGSKGFGLPPSAAQVSGVVTFGGGEDPSLRETYQRVIGQRLEKCVNPMCGNYGNPQKGGICNSCAADENLVHLLIYGDEAIG